MIKYKFGTRSFYELSLDLLSLIFIFSLFIYCMIFHQYFNSIMVSILLKYSLNISDDMLTLLEHGNELENYYTSIKKNLCIKNSENLDYILKNISFKINFGEKICIIGVSQSGKKSIIFALFRLLEITKGAIFINKMNIKNIRIKILRQNLGFV